MADAIHTVRDGNDSVVILNSNQAFFLTFRSAQVNDNWMQLWLVEDSETDCGFEGFHRG